jgi:hypothetical protein
VNLITHQGKIREKLSNKGYYVSQLGLIQENKEDEYVIGDIRYASWLKGVLVGKEEVIITNSNGNWNVKTSRLIEILKEEKIPFRKTRIRKSKLIAQAPLLTNLD